MKYQKKKKNHYNYELKANIIKPYFRKVHRFRPNCKSSLTQTKEDKAYTSRKE